MTTNKEKMIAMFGFSFNDVGSSYDLTCRGTNCHECPLNDRCNRKGIKDFLNEEYKPRNGVVEKISEDSETYKEIFEKGKQAGRNEVYDSLAKIFERKSE